MNSKLLIILPLAIGMAACAGQKGPNWKDNITPDSKYKINSVTTKMSSKCEAPNFMTDTEISDEFENVVKQHFCEKKKCIDNADQDTIVVDINLRYTRTFMGEGFSCSESYAASDISYSFTLKKNDQEFYSKPLSGPYVPQRGLFGNLGRIATQLTFSGGPDKERADLGYLMPGIAKQILKDLD